MYLWKIFRMAEDFDSIKNNQREDDSDSEPTVPLRLDLVDDSHPHLDENRLGSQNSGHSGKNEKYNVCKLFKFESLLNFFHLYLVINDHLFNWQLFLNAD